MKTKFKKGDEVLVICSVPSLSKSAGDTFVVSKIERWNGTTFYFAPGERLPSAPERYLELITNNQ